MDQLKNKLFSGFAVVAAVAAIWMWGYEVGAGKNEALVNFIKEEKETLKVNFEHLQSEAESLKTQLLTASGKAQESRSELSVGIKSPDTIKNISILPDFEELDIQKENTGLFFGGEIQVTVVAINFTGSPLRHQVFAKIIIPGKEPLSIENADPGSAFNVNNFQVIIVSAGTFSAGFKVFKLKT